MIQPDSPEYKPEYKNVIHGVLLALAAYRYQKPRKDLRVLYFIDRLTRTFCCATSFSDDTKIHEAVRELARRDVGLEAKLIAIGCNDEEIDSHMLFLAETSVETAEKLLGSPGFADLCRTPRSPEIEG